MKLTALLFPLAVATALLTVAAAPPAALTLEMKEKRETATLKVGQEFKVILPTTDARYVWEISSNDVRYLKQTGKIAALPGGPTAGATVPFLGARPGRSRLSFAYVRPSDNGETITEDTREIMVTVKQ